MPQRALRFGISDGAGRCASTWKLWTETSGGKCDVYLASRSLGGALKVSLHETGSWHVAYSRRWLTENVADVDPKPADRFIEKWPRPPEIAPGFTLALRIVTPWSAVTGTIDASHDADVTWLTNAPEGSATEVAILLSKTPARAAGWPGMRSMGTKLIGSIPLENGETIWAVYRMVAMPDLTNAIRGRPRFFKGRSEKDLQRGGLRVLILGKEPDESRVLYDCGVKVKTTGGQ